VHAKSKSKVGRLHRTIMPFGVQVQLPQTAGTMLENNRRPKWTAAQQAKQATTRNLASARVRCDSQYRLSYCVGFILARSHHKIGGMNEPKSEERKACLGVMGYTIRVVICGGGVIGACTPRKVLH
jgi:hypothetical protein